MKRGLLIVLVFVAALVGGVMGSIATFKYLKDQPLYNSIQERQNATYSKIRSDSNLLAPKVNFLPVTAHVIKAVVHVRISMGPGEFSLNPLDHYSNLPARSSGSGVIVSDDGYIVTNFHVIEDAQSIEVVLSNNERYYAKVIGVDPTTDLALIKIKSTNLPFIKYGDSDKVVPGEWVLAVGNPFELNSTVTAGIVSGKARNIGIIADRTNLNVESFIQTDAAVNPGNSGGALVNLSGELIGINSAIATTTGGYSGYSFAIPVNLVKKVMDDFVEFGQVQRALLGIQIRDVTADLAEAEQINRVNGVFISVVNLGSTAAEAGLRAGDVITAIDKVSVTNMSELQERVARHRPGKKILVSFLRNGVEQSSMATLKGIEGSGMMEKRQVRIDFDGAMFVDVTQNQLRNLHIDGGAMLKELTEGKWKKAGLEKNFIIRFIDKVPVDNAADLSRILEYKRGGILIEGVYLNGKVGTYGVEW
jgi:Do/DeqQ family serine protease